MQRSTHLASSYHPSTEVPLKSLFTSLVMIMLLGGLCASGASTPDGQTPGRPVSPLLKELNAIAQQQLARRAAAIAAIRDRQAAARRQAEVRARILGLIGGLP